MTLAHDICIGTTAEVPTVTHHDIDVLLTRMVGLQEGSRHLKHLSSAQRAPHYCFAIAPDSERLSIPMKMIIDEPEYLLARSHASNPHSERRLR
jgi:hypothetical protein